MPFQAKLIGRGLIGYSWWRKVWALSPFEIKMRFLRKISISPAKNFRRCSTAERLSLFTPPPVSLWFLWEFV
jgi:hypothetical protein